VNGVTTFGYFLSAEELSPAKLVESAQQAEGAGFERVWISDHFHPWMESQGESAFVWSVLGAIAATTRLQMTTAVTCPTFRIHPVVIAQAAATVAAMAEGRFTLGVGSGEALNEHILGHEWPPVSVRLARLEEAIEIICRLWTGDVVTHEGKYFTVHNARIWSLPHELPQILMSGFGPEAIEVAARVADGWISTSPDSQGMQTYRIAGGRGRTQAGMKICYAESEREAAETAYRLWGHEGAGGQISQDLPMWHGFEALAELSDPDQVAKSVPCGPDPARAAESLAKYVEAGFDEVYISQMGPDQESGMRFLVEQVFPLLK
jgi:G6PDH family F420-dependent oxidoreductase